MSAPSLTRSQTTRIDSEEDDTLEELPALERIPTRNFDGSKSSSTAETLVDFLQSFSWITTQLKDLSLIHI